MSYSIGEVAAIMNVTTSTLRYYDSEGLLPFVNRTNNGKRIFDDKDIELLQVIECLKTTGMSIKDIKIFIDWCIQGDSSLQQRYEMFLERKKTLQKQMETLQKTMDIVNYKCWYYQTAINAGTEKIHNDIKPADVPKHLKTLKDIFNEKQNFNE